MDCTIYSVLQHSADRTVKRLQAVAVVARGAVEAMSIVDVGVLHVAEHPKAEDGLAAWGAGRRSSGRWRPRRGMGGAAIAAC